MVHLISANLCNWGLTLIMEATVDIAEGIKGHPKHEKRTTIHSEVISEEAEHRNGKDNTG